MRKTLWNLKDFCAQIDAFAQPLSQQAQGILDAFHNLQGTRLGSQRKMLDFLNHYASNALKQNLKQGNLPNVEPEPIKDSKQLTGEALAAIRADKYEQQLFEARDTDGPPSGGPRRRQPMSASDRREPDIGGTRNWQSTHGESREESVDGSPRSQNRDSESEGDLTKPNNALIRVSRTDFAQDRKQFRADAERIVRGFIGQKIRNTDTGVDVNIPHTGIKHTLNGAGDDLLLAAIRLPDLLETARYIGAEPDRRNRRNIKRVHKYETDIAVDDKGFLASLVVLEDNQGHQFYGLGLIRERGPDNRERGEYPSTSDSDTNPPRKL